MNTENKMTPLAKLKATYQSHTKEKLAATLFVILIFVMLLGMVTTTHDLGEGFLTTYRTNVPTGAPILERLEGAIDAAEQAVSEGCFCRQQYVEMYGLAMNALGKDVVIDYNYGALYRTKDRQITFSVQEKWIDEAAYHTELLCSAMWAQNRDFLYIQLPFKVAPVEYGGGDDLPIYVHDYANENCDNFLSHMKLSGVSYYDIRDQFWNCGLSQKELFFDTDHHWTIRGAFTATGFIADYLNQNYDFGIPDNLYTDDNFDQTVYKDWFIGTMGRRVGRIYGGVDDFTLYTPKFDTDMTLTQIEGLSEVVTEGSFQDAVLEMKYLEDPDLTTNRYAVYHGDYQELRFENHLAKNDKKILIIKDSFGIPVYSFLSLGISEVRAIDMRLFDKDLESYIADYDPDLVVLMYNGDTFAPEMFNFKVGY